MSLDRRSFLGTCARFGFASTLFPGVLYSLAAQAEDERITPAMVAEAAAIADVPIAEDQRIQLASALAGNRKSFEAMRAIHLTNDIPPSIVFDPMPPHQEPTPPPAGVDIRKPLHITAAPAITGKNVPKDLNEVAFYTVRELGELLRRKKISSLDLTQMYLARLKKYDPLLHFVVNLTEERGLAQAKEADKEIAAGKYRSALHGIPWGGKDLLAVKGYPTTWGAGGFEKQTLDYDAEVVKRLDAAGAILIAKLSLGSLAQGDRWFGGQTRNPWNPEQGASGSSAGPGSATSAGCVAFSIGSETTGSISGPSTRNGVTGLRPTYGFVPRTGAMTLSWSLDKLGPLCRSVEDCALVMQSIWGPDGDDAACRNAFFQWNSEFDWKKLRVGYLTDDFEKPWVTPITPLTAEATEEERRAFERRKAAEPAQQISREYDRRYDLAALDVLRNKMGVKLIPVSFPEFPYDALRNIINVESAAAFDWLTLTGRDKLLTDASGSTWPNSWRIARFYPAVEYIQATRIRELIIRSFAKIFDEVDIIVTPTSGPSNQVSVTNQTGHPAVIVPNGLRGPDAPAAIAQQGGALGPVTTATPTPARGSNLNGGPNTPLSITFLGGLYKDAETCAFAHAYQQITGFHKLHPPLA
jgi:Asp-tRNA(Asn)/Glu-tRNA(Gln) amidotransferase A subunit family amidase